MSVSIKVAVRCRPFTIDDDLGVTLTQCGEEEGEIDVLNSTYTTTRFGFTYAWWSAFGFPRHVKGNAAEAEAMELIDQAKVYSSVGQKIKADLLTGNAVVLFAYGLSGSGKTFTVFGPDAVDEPEAWFKHSQPHPLWGIFPRLAYEVFNQKEDGWKITMKYFQNVVDTVRDLMSPVGKEMHYKSGMKKDADGFTDIDWCSSAVLNTWDDLRKVFRAANARKAIAPTQFNHQSTRGHCIMTLEVEMPHPHMPGMKQKGRVYVCDLAGTEPAGDIVYALYDKKIFDGGDIEYKFLGPHMDVRKTKELQDQGKKINLSLSEMAQFFMKMAEAVQKNTLRPGGSIPGCNSYFLCKYLKDTMLQARTYLFCAIRPEVTYHKYTFSTLGFARNASVVKLKPKMATVKATPAERKLMEELEQMKALVETLRLQQAELVNASVPATSPELGQPTELSPARMSTLGGGERAEEDMRAAGDEGAPKEPEEGGAIELSDEAVKVDSETEKEGKVVEESVLRDVLDDSRARRETISKNAEQVARLQEMLEAKQRQLREVLSGGGEGGDKVLTAEERTLLQQKEEYGRRGISLTHFEADTRLPHLINVDEDPFRHNRFVYLLKKRVTVFGPQGDVQPMSLSVQRKHCSVEVKRGEAGAKGTVTLIGGRGDVWHNGKKLRKQEQAVLSIYDRVAIGGELLLFRWKALRTPDTCPPPTAEAAVMEFKKAMQSRTGRRRSAELHAMEEQLNELQVAKAKAEDEAKSVAAERAGREELVPFSPQEFPDDDRIASVIESAEEDVHMLLSHVKEAEQFMHLFGRGHLTFDVSLQRSQGDTFEVAASVQVKNERTGQSCYVSCYEYLEHHSILGDEVAQLQAALDNGREYTVAAEHDPSLLLLEGNHQLGVATLFTEPIVYMMATEDEERFSVIKNVRAPYGEVGKLESAWFPLVVSADGRAIDPEEYCTVEFPDVDSPKELIGLPWAYRFEIRAGFGLPLTCASAYCQYDLLGETYTTETIQPDPPSPSPVLNYSFVHTVDKMTEEILRMLSKPLKIYLYVGPHVEPEKPEDAISTNNPGVSARFESLRRPGTPSPMQSSPLGRGATTASVFPHSPTSQVSQRGGMDGAGGDPGLESKWSLPLASAEADAESVTNPEGEARQERTATVGASALAVELSSLREENASLKTELQKARAEIRRLSSSPYRGNVEGAYVKGERGSRGGVFTSLSAESLRRNVADGVDEFGSDGVDSVEVDSTGACRSARGIEHRRSAGQSRNRKKSDIDTARVLDAVAGAVVVNAGGQETLPPRTNCGVSDSEVQGDSGDGKKLSGSSTHDPA